MKKSKRVLDRVRLSFPIAVVSWDLANSITSGIEVPSIEISLARDLVGEQLSSGCEGPNHAVQQRIHGSSHCGLFVWVLRGHDDGRGDDIRHEGLHPREHVVGEHFKPFGYLQ
jgi:hypothetical protein